VVYVIVAAVGRGRTESRGQRAESREQRAESREQRAERREQRAESKEQSKTRNRLGGVPTRFERESRKHSRASTHWIHNNVSTSAKPRRSWRLSDGVKASREKRTESREQGAESRQQTVESREVMGHEIRKRIWVSY
jgi:hypothetical protein